MNAKKRGAVFRVNIRLRNITLLALGAGRASDTARSVQSFGGLDRHNRVRTTIDIGRE
jgi:hypothetical protein